MPKSKLIGGILLIVGTSIGGGMLALPVATAQAGITNSIFFLLTCWIIMTTGALLVLEVNLRLPPGSNMISMAKSTLGVPGQIIAWITYLALLYTLLSAYISGGSDIIASVLQKLHIDASDSITTILFTFSLSIIIYHGIKTVDYVNRALMFGKLGVYLLLILIISPHISPRTWQGGSLPGIGGNIMVLIASFGFASIVPSLREYFEDDIPTLRRVIVFGSLIPLLCYIVWNITIMGVVPREGADSLTSLSGTGHETSGLIDALSLATHSHWITGFFGFFSAICMLTAFLGVSLGLFDFLADGLKFKKKGREGKYILALTFLPPLAIVLLNPGIYLKAISYAGICCVILLLLLPAVMAWRGRQKDETNLLTLIPGGNMSLIFVGLIATALLIVATNQI